jgi:hypothetical protein
VSARNRCADVTPLTRGATIVDRDTVESLTELLAAAKRGEVLGVAFTAILRGRRMSYGATGEANNDPILALGHVHVLAGVLQERILARYRGRAPV